MVPDETKREKEEMNNRGKPKADADYFSRPNIEYSMISDSNSRVSVSSTKTELDIPQSNTILTANRNRSASATTGSCRSSSGSFNLSDGWTACALLQRCGLSAARSSVNSDALRDVGELRPPDGQRARRATDTRPTGLVRSS